jgi:predicted DNA-binding protein
MPWEFVGVKMPLELREDLEGLATRDASTLSAVVRRLIEAEAQRNLPRERSLHDD